VKINACRFCIAGTHCLIDKTDWIKTYDEWLCRSAELSRTVPGRHLRQGAKTFVDRSEKIIANSRYPRHRRFNLNQLFTIDDGCSDRRDDTRWHVTASAR
jgi:hypothetical protein